jgi:hypothetical protein
LQVIAREARAFFFLVDEQNKNCVNGWAIPAATVLLMRISGKGFFWWSSSDPLVSCLIAGFPHRGPNPLGSF